MKIEIKKIGNSDGLLLPRELMQRLDLKRGQELHITELAGGGFQAMPYDPDFEKTMEIADQIMDKYKDTLAALAKYAANFHERTERAAMDHLRAGHRNP
jgi:putative addiction module antidote